MSVDALPNEPIRWPAEAIWEAVSGELAGFTVEVLPEIDSTSSELMRRFKGAAGRPAQPEPALLVAEYQNAGRGRLGRSWQGQRGDCLMFSLSLPLEPLDWSGLSLAVGVSVADSLDPLGAPVTSGSPSSPKTLPPAIGLKWPNDLWLTGPLGERKLGGILVETASADGLRQVVIGVGINILPVQLHMPGIEPSAAVPMPAGCLRELNPGIDAGQALLRIVPALVRAVQIFNLHGFAPFQRRFAARDVLCGRQVRLSNGAEGTVEGVVDNGALLLRTATGVVAVLSFLQDNRNAIRQ